MMPRRLRAVELRLQTLQLHFFAGCCDGLGARLRADKQVYVLPCHDLARLALAPEASLFGLLKLVKTAGEVAGWRNKPAPANAVEAGDRARRHAARLQ